MRTRKKMVWGLLALLLLGCAEPDRSEEIRAGRERVVGLPCEGCEMVFVGMPAEMGSDVRIAPEEEPGETMVLTGVVRDRGGMPAEGVVVYAYHTDVTGMYPADAGPEGSRHTHGRLRGWALTDDEGRYTFRTIRPGAYPEGTEPEHVHLHVVEPGRCTYYIDDVVFEGDPNLTEGIRARFSLRGGPGITVPERDGTGAWRVVRDILLGENIPGYPG